MHNKLLQIILNDDKLKRLFFEKAIKTKNINFCHCTPQQKTQIAYILQKEYKKVVCSIGDGGNDVGMIKKASVGLGIRGKEGLQASLASDLSIPDFKSINDLVLWHGRNSMIASSRITLYSFYRSFVYILSMVSFCVFFKGEIDIIFRYPVILLFFNLLTNIFILPFALQTDLSRDQIMDYSRLYRMTQ